MGCAAQGYRIVRVIFGLVIAGAAFLVELTLSWSVISTSLSLGLTAITGV